MQASRSLPQAFALRTGIARTIHLLLSLGVLYVLYMTFMVSVFTSIYSKSMCESALEIASWSIPAAALLGHWIWAGVFVYGGLEARSARGTTWLLGGFAAVLLGLFLLPEAHLILHMPKERVGATLFPAFAAPFVLVALISALLSARLELSTRWNRGVMRTMVAYSVLTIAAIGFNYAVFRPGDATGYLLLPQMAIWAGLNLCTAIEMSVQYSRRITPNPAALHE
jgi:hypothetical protein